MTKAQLDKKLDEVLHTFWDETSFVTDGPYSNEPVTKGELFESHRQVFYTLNEFKKILLDYLD